MEHFKDIDLQKIFEARQRIETIAKCTPLLYSENLSSRWNKNIYLKLENLQSSGSFKLRGAANAILNLSEEERRQGVITMSTGNHGKAVAFVARQLGTKAVICISEMVPEVKINDMRVMGAEVVIAGRNQHDATEMTIALAQKDGLCYISAFDDPHVIAGQGTTALEILEQFPEIDTMVVPVGGGGLMSGVAFTAKTINPHIQIIGVTNDVEPAIYSSLKAGHIVQVGESPSLADVLPGAIHAENQYTFEMCKRYVDDILLISEEQVAEGMAYALLKEKQVLEGAGAATLALLLDERAQRFGQNIAVICSGNSVKMEMLLEIAQQHQDNGREYLNPSVKYPCLLRECRYILQCRTVHP